jgi:hypothetical protein
VTKRDDAHAAKLAAFRGEGAPTDVCTCGHERDLHLSDQCVGCSDRLGCRGFVLHPPVDRPAILKRIAADLERLGDFELERAEHVIANLRIRADREAAFRQRPPEPVRAPAPRAPLPPPYESPLPGPRWLDPGPHPLGKGSR